MKGNFIAKNMNTVNRNSVHRSLKDYSRDYKDELEEGLIEHQLVLKEKQTETEENDVNNSVSRNNSSRSF